MSKFRCNERLLSDTLSSIVSGKIQLPDFQRGWVWDDEHVRSLLVSIARGFPINAFLFWESSKDTNFKTRPIENLTFPDKIPETELLILDGQQRLTSLTQVLKLKTPVKTFDKKKNEIERYYYIDIQKAITESDIDNAFISVGIDKQVKRGNEILDISTTERECEELFFPCNQILDADDWEDKLNELNRENFQIYAKFRRTILKTFREYHLPKITLTKDVEKEAICTIFERVNEGGVSLSVFDLVTASFAADRFNLREDWYGHSKRDLNGRVNRLKKDKLLRTVQSTDFLQAVTLISTYNNVSSNMELGKPSGAVSAKRSDILDLKSKDYKNIAPEIEKGYQIVAKFLRDQCIYKNQDIPYRTQLIPLSAVFSKIGNDWMEVQKKSLLTQWYWCGVFGELYGSTIEGRISNDLEDILGWINHPETEIRTIEDASFHVSRLLRLKSRRSAAFKGVVALILQNQPFDFYWKMDIERLKAEGNSLDIHHIFPRAWCENNEIPDSLYNSIINKTPISSQTNRLIGGKAPSQYIESLLKHETNPRTENEMENILRRHGIDYNLLMNDDFDGFFESRKLKLIEMIEKVTQKKVIRGED